MGCHCVFVDREQLDGKLVEEKVAGRPWQNYHLL